MITLLGKAYKNCKDYVMGTDDDSLPTIQQHEDQQDRGDTIHNERDSKQQVAKTDAHVSEDGKTSFGRDHDTSNTDSNPHKEPAETRQKTRKFDTQPRNNRPPTKNSCLRCDTVANKNAELGAGLAKVNKQLGESERKVQTLKGEKDDLLASVKIEKDSKEGMYREQTEAKKQIRDLQGKNQKLEDELNILKVTLRGVQDKQLHTVKLLEERTADLKVAQTFLTTVDRYAGAEIMKMVEALNAEIFQGAALVSELLGDGNALKVDGRRKNAQLTGSDRSTLSRFIGPKLTEHLSTKSEQVRADPFPLQLAIQAIFTSWCVSMVDSFYPLSASDELKEIYRRIWESEPQAVAGRWRAMMTKQAKHLDSNTQKDAVIELLSNLLRLCGSPMADVASQQTDLHQVVSTILNMWMQLRTAIHEGVTTTEMEVFGPNLNDTYQDEVMKDIYADTEDVQPDSRRRILCAVGMGLRRSVFRQNGDGIMSIQWDIILKAKVAFPSVLSDSV